MSAAQAFPVTVDCAPEARETTLLELVHELGKITTDEREIVATVLSMMNSGRIRLRGNFRGCPIEDFALED